MIASAQPLLLLLARLAVGVVAATTLAGCQEPNATSEPGPEPERIFYEASGAYIVHERGSTFFWMSDDPHSRQTEQHDTGGSVEPCPGDAERCVLLAGFPVAAPRTDCTARWAVRDIVFLTEQPCRKEFQTVTAKVGDAVVTKYVFDARRGVTEFEFFTPASHVRQRYILGSDVGFLAMR